MPSPAPAGVRQVFPVFESLEPRLLLDAQSQAVELFAVSPALFAQNEGQWQDASVRFVHDGSGANVAMTDAGPVFQVFRREADDAAGTPEDRHLSVPLSLPSPGGGGDETTSLLPYLRPIRASGLSFCLFCRT